MNRWKADALKPLSSAPKQKRFLSLDTEDDQLGYGRRTGFYLGCAWGPDGPETFTTRERLAAFLAQDRFSGHYVACHNLEYDLLNVFGPRQVARMYPCFSGSKMCSAVLPISAKHSLRFFDTSCFLQEPLVRLAPLVGLEKLDMEHRPGDRRVTPRRREYCARDAEIVWRLAYWLQEGVNALGAELKLTAASTALDCFRRRYLHEPIPSLPADVQVAMHRGYYGGRVECFRVGSFSDGPYYKNDINGAYVSVMVKCNLPEIGCFERKPHADLTKEGMLHARVTVPGDLWAAPLPVKGEKLTFPVGRLQGWWTYNELRLAINEGIKVDRVLECYHSDRSEAYLSEMMKALRGIRENPDTPAPVARMAKLMGNSLYGKFAQRNENVEYLDVDEFALKVARRELVSGRDFVPERTEEFPAVGVVRVSRPSDFPVHSNVIWSAIVTAGCRGLLYGHITRPMLQAGQDCTYYCDTDSQVGTVAYPKSKALGSMVLEKKYLELVVRGNKLYAGREPDGTWEAHAKGVSRAKALEAVVTAGEGHRIEDRRPVKFRTASRGRDRANRWIAVHKVLSGEYGKRKVLPDGRTEPLEVRQW